MKVCDNVIGLTAFAALLTSACDEPDEFAEDLAAAEATLPDEIDDVKDASGRGVDFEVEDFALERGISHDEARSRLERQSLAPDLAEAARAALGDAFGGVWIDDDDVIKVGATSLGKTEIAAVRRAAVRVGLGDAYHAVQVRFSMAELERANAFLADRLVEVNTGEGPGLIAGMRTDINAVALELPEDAPLSAAQRQLVSSARDRFGALLVVETYKGQATPLACNYPFCDAPLRGGIQISGSGFACTGGFVAASKSDGKLYQFTAGHCAALNYDDWFTRFADLSKHFIGPTWNWKYGLDGDMAIMRINNPVGWQPKPWVNVTNGPETDANSTYPVKSDKASVLGMRVCAAGAALGRSDCGEVKMVGATVQYKDGKTVKGLTQSTVCALPGDSGAPMFSWYVAYGIMSGSLEDQCVTYYQEIQAAENALNVNVLHG